MGYTSVHRNRKTSAREILFDYLGGEDRIEAHYQKGTTHYFRMRVKPEDANDQLKNLIEPRKDGTYSYIVVVLTEHHPKERYNFSFKDIPEFSGPYESDAPLDFITKASKLKDNGVNFAKEFRQRVIRKASLPNFMVKGNKLRFGKPITYGTTEVYEVNVVGLVYGTSKKEKLVFHTDYLGYLRAPKDLYRYEPEIVDSIRAIA